MSVSEGARAVQYAMTNGTKFWVNDEFHREYDLPVEVYSDGMMQWRMSSREQGMPDIIRGDGSVRFQETNSGMWEMTVDEVAVVEYEGVQYQAPYWLSDVYSGVSGVSG